MFRRITFACLLALVMAPCAASASITSLYGDKDGFGQGVPFADGISYIANGGSFFIDARDAGDLANAPNTDFWFTGYPRTWTHNYVLDGPVVSATLQVYAAGFADIGAVDFLIDGVLATTFNFSGLFDTTHILNIPVPIAAIDGSTTFAFANGDSGDGWIIDFAELSVETRSVIPEPGTIAIWSLLIGSCVGVRRRKK